MWLKFAGNMMTFVLMVYSFLTSTYSLRNDDKKLLGNVLSRHVNKHFAVHKQEHSILSKWPNFNYSISWFVYQTKKDVESIAFQIMVDSRINWIGFGFSSPEERGEGADWFVAWKDSKNRVHFKDCNTMHDDLHFDRNQDFHVFSNEKPRTLNLKVIRALNTDDDDDVEIKAGPMQLIWAFGKANKFSSIRSSIYQLQEEKTVVFIPNSDVKSKYDMEYAITTMQPVNVPESKAISHHDIYHNAVGIGEPLKGNSSVKVNKKMKNDKLASKKSFIRSYNASSRTSMRKTNCSVILHDNQNWYELIKLKERGIYYAIIGSSALMTGIIVIAFACFCSRKMPRSAASKMAFYKVDDYDEDQVEFLKERA